MSETVEFILCMGQCIGFAYFMYELFQECKGNAEYEDEDLEEENARN